MAHHICEHCSRPFTSNRSHRRFCSRTCASQSQVILRECQHCGRTAPIRGKFCSRNCASASRVKLLSCQQCGTSFQSKARNPSQKFCSRECATEHKKSSPATKVVMAKARAAAAANLEARKARLPHGFTRYKKRGCRCAVCCHAYTTHTRAYKLRRRDEMTPDERKSEYLKDKDRAQRWSVSSYERSLSKAHRHGHEWTGPELELLARPDLSTRQLAEMLGRTTYAVEYQRTKLRKGEPRSVTLAGVPQKKSAEGA